MQGRDHPAENIHQDMANETGAEKRAAEVCSCMNKFFLTKLCRAHEGCDKLQI